MTKSRCPMEEDNLRKGLDECPLKEICSSSYKEICMENLELAKNFEIII